ncbi:hypothetical protein PPTG_19322 [Phytophthora nicotianae INRA-310]|uniref:Uncharacterized protein n=1 Tax=Phytophthora nicotianae (strain INRA-310) TaxID=761204 RepID=W2PDP4_PHYN3|nr:hypothetical protein PPTG_19322 [Phytophthora nicotianae INRA-310]ETM98760.1 hypothetical protein PPTG_19322 [Phytophthora nicotianae INRA-310]
MRNQRPEETIRSFGEIPGKKSSEHWLQNHRQQRMLEKRRSTVEYLHHQQYHQKENRTKARRLENHLHQLHHRRENHCWSHPRRHRKNQEIEKVEPKVVWRLVCCPNAWEATVYLHQRTNDKVTSAQQVHESPSNSLEHPHRRQIQIVTASRARKR